MYFPLEFCFIEYPGPAEDKKQLLRFDKGYTTLHAEIVRQNRRNIQTALVAQRPHASGPAPLCYHVICANKYPTYNTNISRRSYLPSLILAC